MSQHLLEILSLNVMCYKLALLLEEEGSRGAVSCLDAGKSRPGCRASAAHGVWRGAGWGGEWGAVVGVVGEGGGGCESL